MAAPQTIINAIVPVRGGSGDREGDRHDRHRPRRRAQRRPHPREHDASQAREGLGQPHPRRLRRDAKCGRAGPIDRRLVLKGQGLHDRHRGRITHRIDDSQDEENLLQISWNNSFVGNNEAEALAYYDASPLPPPHPTLSIRSEHYEALSVCGAGDKNAEMRYTLKRRSPR